MARFVALVKRPALIGTVYAIVSWIWIGFSDRLVHEANLRHQAEELISIAKGSIFVTGTAFLIVVLMRLANKELLHARRAEDARTESEQRFRVLADNAPVLVWMSNVDAKFDYFNTEWLRFTGRTLKQELEMGWTEGVQSEDFQRCLDTYKNAVNERRPLIVEFRLRRHDGQYRWVLNNGVPRFTETGAFAGYIGSCVDISDQKEAQAALLSAHSALLERTQDVTARLAAIFEGSEDAIVGYTLDGVVTNWNQAAERLYGYSAEEAIGRRLSLVAPFDSTNEITEILNTVEAGKRIRQRETAETKDGTLIDVSYSSFPIQGSDGIIIGGSTIIHDITKRKKTVEALRRSEERFQFVALATKDLIWDLEIGADGYGEARPSGNTSGIRRKTGNPMRRVVGLRSLRRSGSHASLQTALARHSDSYEAEYRVRRADGSSQ